MNNRNIIYYSVPQDSINDKLPPKLLKRESWEEVNEIDEKVVVEPTWDQYSSKNKGRFGQGYKKLDGKKYLIVCFDKISFLEGHLAELYELGSGKDVPNFTVWGSSEELLSFEWDKDLSNI